MAPGSRGLKGMNEATFLPGLHPGGCWDLQGPGGRRATLGASTEASPGRSVLEICGFGGLCPPGNGRCALTQVSRSRALGQALCCGWVLREAGALSGVARGLPGGKMKINGNSIISPQLSVPSQGLCGRGGSGRLRGGGSIGLGIA